MSQDKCDRFYREARTLFNDGYHKECANVLRNLYNHSEVPRIHLIKTCILLAGVTENWSLAKMWLATGEAKLGEELEEAKRKGDHQNLGFVLDKLTEAINDMTLETTLRDCGDILEDLETAAFIPAPKPGRDAEREESQRERETALDAENWDIDRAAQNGEIEIELVLFSLPYRNRRLDQLADSVRTLWEMDIGGQS